MSENENTVADEAKALVYGEREQAYGHPYDDFTRTAGLWNALFRDKLKWRFTAEDVAAAMRMVKESRLQEAYSRDSLVDIVGYALAQERCVDRVTLPQAGDDGDAA